MMFPYNHLVDIKIYEQPLAVTFFSSMLNIRKDPDFVSNKEINQSIFPAAPSHNNQPSSLFPPCVLLG